MKRPPKLFERRRTNSAIIGVPKRKGPPSLKLWRVQPKAEVKRLNSVSGCKYSAVSRKIPPLAGSRDAPKSSYA